MDKGNGIPICNLLPNEQNFCHQHRQLCKNDFVEHLECYHESMKLSLLQGMSNSDNKTEFKF